MAGPVTIIPDKPSGGVTITPDAAPTAGTVEGQQRGMALSGLSDTGVGKFLTGAYEGAKGAVTGAYGMGKDVVQRFPQSVFGKPDETTYGRFVDQPLAEQGAKAAAALGKTDVPLPYRMSEAGGHGAAALMPFTGPWAAQLGEEYPQRGAAGTAGQLVGGLGTAELSGRIARTGASDIRGVLDPLTWKEGLVEMSHQMLDKSATAAKRQLWDVHHQVSQNVGNLGNELSARAINQSANVSDVLPKIDQIASRYKSETGRLPTFEKVADRLAQGNPEASFHELLRLKSEVGRAAAGASTAVDASAVNEIHDLLNQKLVRMADQVGGDAPKKYAAYNKQWSVLKSYEEQGVLGKLLNAGSGKEFFDILNDPKQSGPLGNMQKDLGNFGLPDDFRSGLRSSHSDIYKFVSDAQGRGFSKLRVLSQHPIAGGVGYMAGKAAGGALLGSPLLGGIAGSLGAGSLVDRIAAAKNIRALGGPAEITGEMGDLGKVRGDPNAPPPTPAATSPTTPTQPSGPSPVARDVESALVNLGYKKADAAQAAATGVAAHPDDFDAALQTSLQANNARLIQQIKTAKGSAPKQGMDPIAQRQWQESVFGQQPLGDPGAAARAKNPEPKGRGGKGGK